MRCELAGSGDLEFASDLVEFSSSPFLVSVSGDACLSNGSPGRYVYQRTEKSGWILFPNCFGGFVPLQVVSSSGEPRLLVVFEALDPWSPGNVMADSHLLQLGRSAIIEHVDVPFFGSNQKL